jgi:hypothetical protein
MNLHLDPLETFESVDPVFRLVPPPNVLWPVARVAEEAGVRPSTILRWVRLGRFPRCWVKRRGRQLWAPELVEQALEKRRELKRKK